MLENRFELILRGLIRAGSSHTMSPAAKIKTRSGQMQIYAMPTFGQVGQSEQKQVQIRPTHLNKRKKGYKNCIIARRTNKKTTPIFKQQNRRCLIGTGVGLKLPYA